MEEVFSFAIDESGNPPGGARALSRLAEKRPSNRWRGGQITVVHWQTSSRRDD